jgi:hypothetical protein
MATARYGYGRRDSNVMGGRRSTGGAEWFDPAAFEVVDLGDYVVAVRR